MNVRYALSVERRPLRPPGSCELWAADLHRINSVIRIALIVVLVLTACSRPADRSPVETASGKTAPPVKTPPPVKAPDVPAAGIRTDRTAYVLTPGKHGLETTIVATLRAPADQTLYILNCNGGISATLQRKVGDEWVWALLTGMAACMSPPIIVPPGGEYTKSLHVNEAAGTIRDPQGGTMLQSGTYRVVWTGVLTSFNPKGGPDFGGPELPLEQRVSAPITIEVPVRR